MSETQKIAAEDPANRQAKKRSIVPPPRIERSLRLQFQGDWGRANLHRALGFLGYELTGLAGLYTRYAIWNGRGGRDNVQAVGRGEVDVALAVPVPFMRMAMEGKGPCAGESFPHLRMLGYVPQHDRMIVALRRDLGINSWADWREKKPKLRITLGPNDNTSFIGIAGHMLLEAHGLPRAELEKQGCRFIEHEEPRGCTVDMLEGEADAIVQEAVMTSYWQELANKRDLVFLPIEPHARDKLKAEYALPSATLRKDYLRGIDREMEFLDFSHFALITTTDLPEDVAYALAWALIERYETLEMQYRHIPPERSPVSYPIDPKAACRTPIPLHPGAERYYRDAGHLTKAMRAPQSPPDLNGKKSLSPAKARGAFAFVGEMNDTLDPDGYQAGLMKPEVPSRVLVVDDDEAFRYATVKMLADAGFETAEAPDYRQALDILDDKKPLALLVMDIVVPGVNGFALARMARMRHRGLKVIYVSGFDVPTHEAIGPVLRKPVEGDVLMAEIHKSLGGTV